jgi:hypothetical protein
VCELDVDSDSVYVIEPSSLDLDGNGKGDGVGCPYVLRVFSDLPLRFEDIDYIAPTSSTGSGLLSCILPQGIDDLVGAKMNSIMQAGEVGISVGRSCCTRVCAVM